MNFDASLLKQGTAYGQEGAPVAPPPRLLNLLETSHHVLCISHVSPDGDAVGSLLGVGAILRALGKQPVLALQDELTPEYQFLPRRGDDHRTCEFIRRAPAQEGRGSCPEL